MPWKTAAWLAFLLFTLGIVSSGCGTDLDDDNDGFGEPPRTDTTEVTVNFTVTGAPEDSVNAGLSSIGSFSFDSSIVPDSGGVIQSPPIHGFHLVWDGTTWNDGNTSAGSVFLPGLAFDSTGTLTNFFIWGDPAGDGMDGSELAPDDFMMPEDAFVYHRGGVFGNGVDAGPFVGTLSWSVTMPPIAASRRSLATRGVGAAPARLIAPR